MEYGLSDTDPETARVHLELLRSVPAGRRLGLALSLSRTAMSLSRARLARDLPNGSPREVGLRFVAPVYGAEIAEAVRADIDVREP